jgi:hypothetical protein
MLMAVAHPLENHWKIAATFVGEISHAFTAAVPVDRLPSPPLSTRGKQYGWPSDSNNSSEWPVTTSADRPQGVEEESQTCFDISGTWPPPATSAEARAKWRGCKTLTKRGVHYFSLMGCKHDQNLLIFTEIHFFWCICTHCRQPRPTSESSCSRQNTLLLLRDVRVPTTEPHPLVLGIICPFTQALVMHIHANVHTVLIIFFSSKHFARYYIKDLPYVHSSRVYEYFKFKRFSNCGASELDRHAWPRRKLHSLCPTYIQSKQQQARELSQKLNHTHIYSALCI